MRNISIRGKFLVLLAGVTVFVVAAVGYSGSVMIDIDRGYNNLLDGKAAAATALARANRALQTTRATIGDLLMARDDAANAKALAEYSAAREMFLKSMDVAISGTGGDAELSQLKTSGTAILDTSCKPSIDAGKLAVTDVDVIRSQDLFLRECQPAFPEISKKLVTAFERLTGSADAERNVLISTGISSIWQTAVLVLIGLAALLATGLFGVQKWLVTPVQGLADTMKRLANGDVDAVINDRDRRDEIGAMAMAVQTFKDNELRAREQEQQADLERNRSDLERNRRAVDDRAKAEAMAAAASGLAEGLRRLSSGDLRHCLNEPFSPDFEGLRADFNDAVRQLANTLAAVGMATSSIDGGVREISSSADDLSKRTEQQAASLEETAAALDQITTNVTNASRRAEDARGVAQEAERSAGHSTEIVSRAIEAIEKIEKSSKAISGIIGVIDEIAFQTNLLALNAGVEAARAGEAGKGFAVVAQEVRELAQRSAQAAREIKTLIQSSEGHVTDGVDLVRKTGEALGTIQRHVGLINEHMAAIALASKEQSAGLTQVNTAVNEMDQVTQRNATMVEEANAASATLANESANLRQLVSAFSLPAGKLSDRVPNRSASSLPAPARAVSSPRRAGTAQAAAVNEWQEF